MADTGSGKPGSGLVAQVRSPLSCCPRLVIGEWLVRVLQPAPMPSSTWPSPQGRTFCSRVRIPISHAPDEKRSFVSSRNFINDVWAIASTARPGVISLSREVPRVRNSKGFSLPENCVPRSRWRLQPRFRSVWRKLTYRLCKIGSDHVQNRRAVTAFAAICPVSRLHDFDDIVWRAQRVRLVC